MKVALCLTLLVRASPGVWGWSWATNQPESDAEAEQRLAHLSVPPWTDTANFLPQCTSPNDYGWPRFHSRATLEADGRWSKYLTAV